MPRLSQQQLALLVTIIIGILATLLGLQLRNTDSFLMRRFILTTPSFRPNFQSKRAFTVSTPTMSNPPTQSDSTLGLPAPPTAEEARKLDLSKGQDSVKLDHLGPLVVNKDGSLGRITNWEGMTEQERERTVKILGKRNQLRMEGLKKEEGEGGEKA